MTHGVQGLSLCSASARPRLNEAVIIDPLRLLWYGVAAMLKMRLQRTGRRNNATFRVVVTDSRRGPKSEKHADRIGSYNPASNDVRIDGERAVAWIEKGVQVSDTVHNLLVAKRIIEGKKRNVLPCKAASARDGHNEVAPEAEAGAPADTQNDTSDNAEAAVSQDEPAAALARNKPEQEEEPART